MATTFQVIVAGRDADYARQAASAAFRELERIESELSRFVESSDIARVNRLKPGETALIGEDTMRCLIDAARVSDLTGRAFDPAFRSQRDPSAAADAPLFALDAAAHTVTSLCARLQLDLGAVGKGYALDRMAEVLGEWDVASALVQSGGSTVLALDPPAGERGWSIGIGDLQLDVARTAVAGSGISVQGEHIADPRTGGAATRTRRTWSFAPTAAGADALSTAFFVMTDADVASFCTCHPEFGAAIATDDGTIIRHGTASGL